ncbi:MAG: hypothetical protein NTV24_02955 [Candidatus Woesebacteria bacterium]|nr:hypothetical protein [Candidatus Woesebacteria bacterium]
MVDKFKKILSRIIEEKGTVTVFAVLKMDEFVDKWTVIFSAPWSIPTTLETDFEYIRKLLREELTEEERSLIARIGIFPKDEHLINLILQLKSETTITEDTKLNGNVIHEGYVLASNG